MAQVTPPVGFNLFVLQGMTKREIGYISRAAFPFFLLMVLMVVLLYVFPQIVTFLPTQMRGCQLSSIRSMSEKYSVLPPHGLLKFQ